MKRGGKSLIVSGRPIILAVVGPHRLFRFQTGKPLEYSERELYVVNIQSICWRKDLKQEIKDDNHHIHVYAGTISTLLSCFISYLNVYTAVIFIYSMYLLNEKFSVK